MLGLVELAYATYLLTKGSGWAALWFVMGLSDLRASKKYGFLDGKSYRLNDIVLYNRQTYTITGRRSSGYFQLKNYKTGEKLPSISYKKLKLLEKTKCYTTERIARN